MREDYELGQKMGVNLTPMFYVNGRALIGAQPFDAFKQIIDEELARVGNRLMQAILARAIRWSRRPQARNRS